MYAFTSDTLDICIDKLVEQQILPSIYVLDNDVYYSEMPIIAHRELTKKDLEIPLPIKNPTSATIFYSKTDIINFITDNDLKNEL